MLKRQNVIYDTNVSGKTVIRLKFTGDEFYANSGAQVLAETNKRNLQGDLCREKFKRAIQRRVHVASQVQISHGRSHPRHVNQHENQYLAALGI